MTWSMAATFRQKHGINVPSEILVTQKTGFTVIDSFRLPGAGWGNQYYSPVTERIPCLKEKYATNPGALDIIQG